MKPNCYILTRSHKISTVEREVEDEEEDITHGEEAEVVADTARSNNNEKHTDRQINETANVTHPTSHALNVTNLVIRNRLPR